MVVVGGVLLKFEQEVVAPPGTHVILNFNNKVRARQRGACSGDSEPRAGVVSRAFLPVVDLRWDMARNPLRPEELQWLGRVLVRK